VFGGFGYIGAVIDCLQTTKSTCFELFLKLLHATEPMLSCEANIILSPKNKSESACGERLMFDSRPSRLSLHSLIIISLKYTDGVKVRT